jgi:hypothetical protein
MTIELRREWRRRGIANARDDFMTTRCKRRMKLAPDESRCAQEKDAHVRAAAARPPAA